LLDLRLRNKRILFHGKEPDIYITRGLVFSHPQTHLSVQQAAALRFDEMFAEEGSAGERISKWLSKDENPASKKMVSREGFEPSAPGLKERSKTGH